MDAHTKDFISRIDEEMQFMVQTALTAVRDGSPRRAEHEHNYGFVDA